jgi:methylated-DNA-protein-cysteine methyltransferase-like protein
MEAPTLYEQIYAMVDRIPHGEIASYSQVAAAVGMPRGARIVGWALGALPRNQFETLPWWRVVNKQRQLTITNPNVGPEEQRARLEREGRQLELQEELYRVTGDDWWIPPVAPPREP